MTPGAAPEGAESQQPEAPALPGVTRWRKRPVVVSAIQWTGANADELRRFAGYMPGSEMDMRFAAIRFDLDGGGDVFDKLHSWVPFKRTDWIIRGVQNEFYPCDSDVFAATYEPAGEAGAPAVPPAPVAAAVRGSYVHAACDAQVERLQARARAAEATLAALRTVLLEGGQDAGTVRRRALAVIIGSEEGADHA